MILLTQIPSFVSGYLGMSLPSGAKTSGYESEESPGDVGNKGKCFGEEKERRRQKKSFMNNWTQRDGQVAAAGDKKGALQ